MWRDYCSAQEKEISKVQKPLFLSMFIYFFKSGKRPVFEQKGSTAYREIKSFYNTMSLPFFSRCSYYRVLTTAKAFNNLQLTAWLRISEAKCNTNIKQFNSHILLMQHLRYRRVKYLSHNHTTDFWIRPKNADVSSMLFWSNYELNYDSSFLLYI